MGSGLRKGEVATGGLCHVGDEVRRPLETCVAVIGGLPPANGWVGLALLPDQ